MNQKVIGSTSRKTVLLSLRLPFLFLAIPDLTSPSFFTYTHHRLRPLRLFPQAPVAHGTDQPTSITCVHAYVTQKGRSVKEIRHTRDTCCFCDETWIRSQSPLLIYRLKYTKERFFPPLITDLLLNLTKFWRSLFATWSSAPLLVGPGQPRTAGKGVHQRKA